ncbi:MAG: hypothetical protein QF464_02805 [Myxococcota bacterium]|nr:hypothetical protein [Myxococcota bacterium]
MGCSTPSDATPDAFAAPDASVDVEVSGVASLVDHTLWAVVPQQEDPFYPEDDTEVEPCPASQYGPEVQGDDVWFSVETVNCNYLTVQQPLLVDVPSGAQLRVRVWHFEFTYAEGTYVHAIAVGEPPDTLWETEAPLPLTSGGLLPFELVPITRPLTAGEPVYWHLRNHGLNSWHLIEVSAHPATAP